MTTLYLIRHGETDHNNSGRMQGWLDVPLNATGMRQAELLARRFRGKHIDAIYASPLSRAAATAQAIAEVLNVAVVLDERIREYHMGDWAGRTAEEIQAVTPGYVIHSADEVPIPNGETADDMHARLKPFLQDLRERHADERVIAVSHGGTLAMAVAMLLNMPVVRRQPFSFGNTAIAKAEYAHGRWRLRTLNDQCHLHVHAKETKDAVDGG
jgi:broad specificity phosphatase PhoE